MHKPRQLNTHIDSTVALLHVHLSSVFYTLECVFNLDFHVPFITVSVLAMYFLKYSFNVICL